MGFDLLVKELHEINFDSLVISQAVEIRKLLRESLDKSEAWFSELSGAFGPAIPKPAPALQIAQPSAAVAAKPGKPKVFSSQPRDTGMPKRGRGRPRKNPVALRPEIVAPDDLNLEDHAAPLPTAILNGSSFLRPGERPNNYDQLPPGHPRNGGGGSFA